MSESNNKAYDVARLGFVHVTQVDDQGRPVEAIVPAQHGEFATVKLARKGSEIKVMSCVHRPMGGGAERACEAHSKGQVCYHAKAILVWVARCREVGAVLCSDEAQARGLVDGKADARVARLFARQGEQWIAFLPDTQDEEACRKAQEVAHLTQAMAPLLEAVQAMAPRPKPAAKKKAS